jgi:hypothetical protein
VLCCLGARLVVSLEISTDHKEETLISMGCEAHLNATLRRIILLEKQP